MKSLETRIDGVSADPPEENRVYHPSLYLDDQQTKALGVNGDVGSEVLLTFRARVTSVSQSESEEGGLRRSISFDLLEGEAGRPGRSDRERADALYGNGGS